MTLGVVGQEHFNDSRSIKPYKEVVNICRAAGVMIGGMAAAYELDQHHLWMQFCFCLPRVRAELMSGVLVEFDVKPYKPVKGAS